MFPIPKFSFTVALVPSQIMWLAPWYYVHTTEKLMQAYRDSLSCLYCLQTSFPWLMSALSLVACPCDALQQKSALALLSHTPKVAWRLCLPWKTQLMTDGHRLMKAQLPLLELGQIIKCNLQSRVPFRIHLSPRLEIFFLPALFPTLFS